MVAQVNRTAADRAHEPAHYAGARYERRMVGLLTLGSGVAALDAQAVFYLMPFIVTDLRISNSQVGLIGTAVLIGWSISALIVGISSDRIGRRKPFLVAAYLCFAALSGLSALASSFAVLFAARLLIGLAEGPVIPIQQTMVMAESAPARRGLNMGLVQNLGSQLIGTLGAPLFVVWLAGHLGWRSSFLISAAPALIVALLVWRMLREPPKPMAERSSVATPADRKGGFSAVLREHNLRICVAITSCCVAWYFLLLTFMPLRLSVDLKLSPGTMSVVMSMLGAAGALASFLVPGLSDRIGRRSVIAAFGFVGVVAPLGAILLGPDPLLIGAAALVGGLFIGTISLVMATVPQESLPPDYAATATALVLCVSQLVGGVLGVLLGGRLADSFGLRAPLLLAAAFAVAAGLLSFGLRETVGIRRPGSDDAV